MNRHEFLGFISNLNDIWPKSYENQKKNEYLFNLIKYYEANQMVGVFGRLLEDNHHAPSISKIQEAIRGVIGSDRVAKDKAEFIAEVESGSLWCKYCGCTGFCEVKNSETGEIGAMRCGYCKSASRLRLSKDIPEFYDFLQDMKFSIGHLFLEESPHKTKRNRQKAVETVVTSVL